MVRWYSGAVSFATLFAVVAILLSYFVVRDITPTGLVGSTTIGRGFPLAWLSATTSLYPGATAVPSIDFLGLILDYILWWIVGFCLGALVFGALEGFE